MRHFFKAPPKTQPPVNATSLDTGSYGLVSYSQEGEDLVLKRFMKEKSNGFYVDVGAHHPERFSNTLYYYKRGWHGINIDADPVLMEEFSNTRPKDTNLAYAVGLSNKPLTFYVFNERAINTFDSRLAKERAAIKGYRIIEKKPVKIKTLASILDEYLPKKQTIDFMSVDVEGHDIEVLKSNEWNKYRPSFLLVECLKTKNLASVEKSATTRFLKQKRYEPIAKMLNTVIFANMDNYGK